MKEGWKYIDFKEVYPIKMGKTPPRGDKSSWDVEKKTQNRWVSIADLSANEGRTILETKEYISDSAAQKIYKAPKDSLLMSFKLSIGKMAFAGTDLYTNEAIIAIPKTSTYDLRFIYFYLQSYNWKSLTEGNEKVKGATLNKQSIGRIQLPIIGIDEQQRIVTYLDSAFAKIDALKKNAEKMLNEAKALFAAALKEAMTPQEGWEEKKIGEVFKSYSGGTPMKSHKEFYEGGHIPWLRSGEVCQQYITETEMFITEEGLKNSSAKFYPKDTVVIAMYGATAAQVGILKIEATSNQAVCGLLPNEDYLPEYVYFWFTAIQKELAAQAQGGAQPNISQEKIKKVSIPVIDIEKQTRIVAHLDSLSAKVRQLEDNYRKTIAECDAMKQAILRETFE